MENIDASDGEKQTSDGLELISIGSLYTGGPWDKKYWSCSRGKDRYPYPIGYHAVRTHAGNTYWIEIREGLKGPLFVITSMNGEPCFGQTPDIAWRNFQKRSGPRVKTWHAKRLSCKIDGVEFFGFRNPFVQRLLRHLVANVNGTAEQSLISSNFCNGASRLEHEKRSPESCTYPDLLPCFGRLKSTGKRSQKQKSIAKNANEHSLKRPRPQDLSIPLRVGIARKDTQENGGFSHGDRCDVDYLHEENGCTSAGMAIEHEVPYHLPIQSQKESFAGVNDQKSCSTSKCFEVVSSTLDGHCVIHDYSGTAPVPDNLAALVERCNDISADCLVAETIFPEEQVELVPKDCSFTGVPVTHSKVRDNPLDSSSDVDLQVADSLEATNAYGVENLISTEVKFGKDCEYCAPDTLDTLQADIADSAAGLHERSHYSVKAEFASAEQLSSNPTSHTEVFVAKDATNEPSCGNVKCFSENVNALPTISQEMSCPVLWAADSVLSQEQITGFHPKEELFTSSNSNESPEKSDSDSNRQEFAKSMMTVLLPRALPLLKKTYKRRRKTVQNAKTSFTKCDTQLNLMETKSLGENDGLHYLTDVSQGKLAAEMAFGGYEVDGKCNLHGTTKPLGNNKIDPSGSCKTKVHLNRSECIEDVKSVIPDSLEDDQTGCNVANHRSLHSNNVLGDCAPFNSKVCSMDLPGLLSNADGVKESSKSYLRNDEDSAVFHNEVGMPLENAETLIFDSPLSCASPNGLITLERKTGRVCMIGDQNTLHSEQLNICPADEPLATDGFRGKSGLGCNQDVWSSDTKQVELACLPSSCTINLGTVNGEAPETSVVQTHDTHCFSSMDARDEKTIGSAGTAKMVVNGKITFLGTHDTSIQREDAATSTQYCTISHHPSRKYDVPLSESIICRNIQDNGNADTFSSVGGAGETIQIIAPGKHIKRKMSLATEGKLDGEQYKLSFPEGVPESECIFMAPQNHEMLAQPTKSMHSQAVLDLPIPHLKSHRVDAKVNEPVSSYGLRERNTAVSCVGEKGAFLSGTNGSAVYEVKIDSTGLCNSNLQQKNLELDGSFPEATKPNYELEDFVELIGCYLHPTPVLFTLLRRKGNDIHICVLCGSLEDGNRSLFIYKVPINGAGEKYPSFLGFASIMLPWSKAIASKEIVSEGSGLQFAPVDQCLVLINSVKAPYCREQNMNCSCSLCKYDCCDENAVKVVRVQFGYVSVVVKLATAESIYCILVCEPCHLVAAEESGRLHVWIMNTAWSAAVDEFVLPSFDYICPSILELKRMPKSSYLVIGHNGIGGFGLWDISKRILVARFSSPGYSVSRVLPVGFFSWKRTISKLDEHIEEMMAATEMCFSGAGVDHGSLPPNGDGTAVWLLVSAASDSDAELGHPADIDTRTFGLWRLALLVENRVIMGSILDSRASALDVSSGRGIIGTSDGLVYKWELSTGKRLVNLHHFVGSGVSCIATEVESGILAIADNDGKLLVYNQLPRNSAVDEPNGR